MCTATLRSFFEAWLVCQVVTCRWRLARDGAYASLWQKHLGCLRGGFGPRTICLAPSLGWLNRPISKETTTHWGFSLHITSDPDYVLIFREPCPPHTNISFLYLKHPERKNRVHHDRKVQSFNRSGCRPVWMLHLTRLTRCTGWLCPTAVEF